MKANLKAAAIAAKYTGGEDEKKKKDQAAKEAAAKKEQATKEAISKAQGSGTASKVAEGDTSATASIYYRGYDKNNKEIRISQEDMPQSDDEKTKLAWKHGVRSWSKVTMADADNKNTSPVTKKMPPQKEEKSFVRTFGSMDNELEKERFNFRR